MQICMDCDTQDAMKPPNISKRSEQISIRAAVAAEASLLAGIIRRSYAGVAQRFGLTPQNCPQHPSNCNVTWLQADFDQDKSYFVLDLHEPAGCVAMECAGDALWYLERLAVLPRYRRQGYGELLVRFVLERVRAKGGLTVGIGLIDAQEELKQWYRRLGFVHTGTRSFDHLPFTVGFMQYRLGTAGRGV